MFLIEGHTDAVGSEVAQHLVAARQQRLADMHADEAGATVTGHGRGSCRQRQRRFSGQHRRAPDGVATLRSTMSFRPGPERLMLSVLLGPVRDEAAHSVGFPLAPDAGTGVSLRGDLRSMT